MERYGEVIELVIVLRAMKIIQVFLPSRPTGRGLNALTHLRLDWFIVKNRSIGICHLKDLTGNRFVVFGG